MSQNKKLKILITGAGAPGIIGTINSLRTNYDKRNIFLIGTDVDEKSVGKHLCDQFYKISHSSQIENYLSNMLDICKKDNVDVIIPQNTMELTVLSNSKNHFESYGVKIMISDYNTIKLANDKYKLMEVCKNNNLPVGEFYLINNKSELHEKAKLLGWPDKKIVIKPPRSHGSRGVRIIDEKFDKAHNLFYEKPSNMTTDLVSLSNIINEEFPDMILTEYLAGIEYSVDFLIHDKIVVVPRVRSKIRSGITFRGHTENNKEIIEITKKLGSVLGLKYCNGFQFKLDENRVPKIIECNPRVQGTMIISTLSGANLIYSGVKVLLGEDIPDFNINWGFEFNRYWGGIGVNENSEILVLC